MARLVKTLKGLWSLVIGLKITGVEFCRPWLTVQYPRQEVKNLASFRGHIELVPASDNPAASLCIMCFKCVEICPSHCISLQMHVKGDGPDESAPEAGLFLASGVLSPDSVHKAPPPEKIERVLDDYRVKYSLCSLCGLCVQICPVSAIRFSRDAYLVSTQRQSLELDLLKRLRSPAAPAEPPGRDSSPEVNQVAGIVADFFQLADQLKIRNLKQLPSRFSLGKAGAVRNKLRLPRFR